MRMDNVFLAPATAENAQITIKEHVNNVGSDFILTLKEVANFALLIVINAIMMDALNVYQGIIYQKTLLVFLSVLSHVRPVY